MMCMSVKGLIMSHQDKKTQKKILKLVLAIRNASDNDLILLNSLCNIAVLMRDSQKTGGCPLRILVQRETENISSDENILSLLNK